MERLRLPDFKLFALLKNFFLFYNEETMKSDDFNQFHYHRQTNKNIDGIILVPKNKDLVHQETKIASEEPKKIDLFPYKAIGNKKIKPMNKILEIIMAFSLIFLFSILPIRILESSSNMSVKAKEGFDQLKNVYESIKNNNYDIAKKDLLSINKNIGEINKELDDMGQKNIFLSRFSIINEAGINDERFFEIVFMLSRIGNKIIDDLTFVEKIKIPNLNGSEENPQLFQDLGKMNQDLKSTENDFKTLKLNIAKINDRKMNDQEKKYLSLIKNNIDEIEKYYNSVILLTNSASSILGENYDKKYLVLFQNNTEIRATGGFIGTYGIINIRNTKIKNIFIDSIYNPDGQISKKIEPPEPLKKITPNLAMRDANWYPDFPASAKNISDLYELEGGFTPDGIIAFDTKPFLDLLRITGPIKIKKYDIEINKENFIPLTQFKTSVDYYINQNNPKEFLSDFAHILLEKLSEQNDENQKKILAVLINNIKEKHIQFYSSKKDIQNAFVNLNIAGEIKNNKNTDYFAYINSNIGGLKTNFEITDELNHKIIIDQKGKIIRKAELKRKHKSSTDGNINYAYLRFYLPGGSKITDVKNFEKKDSLRRDAATGMIYLEEREGKYLGKAKVEDMDIYEELGKTVIGGWQVIKPQEEILSEITYQLPNNIKIKDDIYKILIQKQSGIIAQPTSIQIIDSANKKSSLASFDLKKDELFSLILK